ncbi:MAG TPA: LssY C-terminal domain-containing protein [Thermoanaerobaculia bacterium]
MTWHAATVLFGRLALLGGLAAALFLLFLLPHRGWRWVRGPARRALRHPALAPAARRLPAVFGFAERHFGGGERSWLRLALGALFVGAGLRWFARVLAAVLTDGTVVVADRRLHNTVAAFHSPAMQRSLSLATDLASAAYVVPLVAAAVVLFWLGGLRREGLFLCAALAGAGLFAAALKYVVQRPRPVDWYHGYSFPSAHTLVGTAVYGFLGYLVLRDDPRRPWRLAAVLPLAVLLAAIPLSRIYLGVHWPYDTVASLALSLAWLAILVALYKLPPFEERLPAPGVAKPWLRPALAGLAAAAVAYAALFAARPPHRKAGPVPRPPSPIAAAALAAAFPARLEKTSQDLVGGPMEPIAFVFLGSRPALEQTFERAGWYLADPPSIRGLARELAAVVADRPDPHGPATPAYYQEEPQDLTFEKPGDASGSIRHRHHIRIWRTGLDAAPGAVPVWAATSSYDAGVKLVAKPYLVTHRIDPRIDRERELIAGDLLTAGARPLARVTVTGPTRGKNAGEDSFVTDGVARVLALP